jgi:hypothetical protein
MEWMRELVHMLSNDIEHWVRVCIEPHMDKGDVNSFEVCVSPSKKYAKSKYCTVFISFTSKGVVCNIHKTFFCNALCIDGDSFDGCIYLPQIEAFLRMFLTRIVKGGVPMYGDAVWCPYTKDFRTLCDKLSVCDHCDRRLLNMVTDRVIVKTMHNLNRKIEEIDSKLDKITKILSKE